MCDRSSKPGLRDGETVSGLVSQEPVLCSEVAMVVVILGGIGSSSSSSRNEPSGMSGEGTPMLVKSPHVDSSLPIRWLLKLTHGA